MQYEKLAQQLLDEREERYIYQKQLLKKFSKTLVVIKTNYPGANKNNHYTTFLATKTFFNWCDKDQIVTYYVKSTLEGVIYYIISDLSLTHAKRLAIEIEKEELGRLLDIDVFADGKSLSRSDLDIERRKCFICNQQAIICVRSQAHTFLDLKAYFESLVLNNFNSSKLTKKLVSDLILFGLSCELNKPFSLGCVHFNHSGSHQDMDIYTFLKSIDVLKNKLQEIVELDTHDFLQLRKFGIEVEDYMFCATSNVNTYKGAIFLLILVFSGLKNAKNYQDIQFQIKKLCSNILDDFNNLTTTNGINVYRKYHVSGIRKLAHTGLESLFNKFEPFYDDIKDPVKLYFLLVSEIDDTTVIHRSDYDTLTKLKKMANESINDEKLYHIIDDFCLNNKISCGGSADCFAIVLILNLVKNHFDFKNL